MKSLKVDSICFCDECPYFRVIPTPLCFYPGAHDGDGEYHLHSLLNVAIPEWCPLDDMPPKIIASNLSAADIPMHGATGTR